MKIAQYTLNGYSNYGNVLQKYALNRILKRYAKTVDVLWGDPDNFLPETWDWDPAAPDQIFHSAVEHRRFGFESVRQSKIKAFCDRHMNTRYDFEDYEDLADQYDYFVIGSDQIWNPAGLSAQCFLPFAAREKKISYAASITMPSIPQQFQEYFKRGLSNIAWLSVREDGAARIIKDLTGRDAEVLVDPIMLLTVEQWREMSQRPPWFDERYSNGYILSYFLRESAPSIVEEISVETKLPTIKLLDLDVFDHYATGVEEFLFLIEHASLIYTNSFYGAAFSILFNRPLVVCNLQRDAARLDMTSRLTHLLTLFALNARQANEQKGFHIEKPFEMNYVGANEVLKRERVKAMHFLDEAFRGIESED